MHANTTVSVLEWYDKHLSKVSNWAYNIWFKRRRVFDFFKIPYSQQNLKL